MIKKQTVQTIWPRASVRIVIAAFIFVPQEIEISALRVEIRVGLRLDDLGDPPSHYQAVQQRMNGREIIASIIVAMGQKTD